MNAVDQSPSLRHTTRPQSAFSFFRQIRLGFALTGVLLLAAPSAWAHPNNAVSPATANMAQAELLTHRLAGLSRAFEKAPSSDQAERLQTLMMVAEERQQLLLDMAHENPGGVLRVALPEHVRTVVPDSVRAKLESRADQTGTVEVICVHDERGSPTKYFLQTATDRLSLHFRKNPPDLLTGEKVTVSGLTIKGKRQSMLGQTDGATAIDSGDQDILLLAAGGEETTQGTAEATSSAPLPNTMGEQRTAVILYQYANSPVTPPKTAQEMYDYVFGEAEGSVNQFFKEQSYDQTWLAGDVYGWYRISITGEEECANNTATDLAKEQAALDGFNEEGYDRILMVASNRACSNMVGGWAQVGGKNAWVTGIEPSTGDYELYHFGHEIGHTFGIQHAHAWDCVTTTLGDNCENREYGDKFDTMGAGIDLGHYNLFQKELLGWIGEATLLDVTQDGQFTIDLYEPLTTGPKGIKISKGFNPNNGQPTWYYLEYRQPILIDEFIQDFSYRWGRGDVTDSVLIHMGEPADHNSSFLLHMNPANSEYFDVTGIPDWWDPGLHTGQTYDDPQAGIRIETQSTDGSQATISVTMTNPPCQHVDPTVEVSPQESQWVPPGTTVTYNMTVTNGDGPECGMSNFALDTVIPENWTHLINDPTLTLSPGQTATTTTQVTSPPPANDGFFDIMFHAHNQQEPNADNSTMRTYVVSQDGTNDAPIVTDDEATTQPGVPILIHVLANDVDPEGQPLSVQYVTQGSQGTVTINADFSVTYSPASKTKPRDSFTYTVSDGEMSTTGTVRIKFEKADGGGGGKGGGKPNR